MARNSRLSRSENLLVIVDLQHAFPVPKTIVAGIRRAMRGYDRCLFTRFVNPRGSLFRKLMKMDACPPGSPDTALLIEPRQNDLVFTKQGYGLTPRHIRRLRRLGVARASVCGIDTDACVLGVMFSLVDAGIDCRAVPQLCWSSSGLHREAVRIIKNQFPAPRTLTRTG
jgi:nicotinamidase-related amidase